MGFILSSSWSVGGRDLICLGIVIIFFGRFRLAFSFFINHGVILIDSQRMSLILNCLLSTKRLVRNLLKFIERILGVLHYRHIYIMGSLSSNLI